MSYVIDFFGNYMLITTVTAWLIAQIVKMVIGLIRERSFKVFKRFFANGGMPSSHASAVCALMTAAFIQEGAGSPAFAITFILAAVVMVDASGVRYETGEQAKIINKIVRELFSGDSKEVNTGLKELVGHTPFQVVIGAGLGIVVGILMSFLML